MLVWPISSPKMTRMFGLVPPGAAAGRGGGVGGVGCACATAVPPESPEAASAVPASSMRRRLTVLSLSLMVAPPLFRRPRAEGHSRLLMLPQSRSIYRLPLGKLPTAVED